MSALTSLDCALVALFVPLLAAAVIALVYPLRQRGKPAALISIAAALASLVASVTLLLRQLELINFQSQAGIPAGVSEGVLVHEIIPWIPGGAEIIAEVGVHLDGISVSMLLVVTLVATCVQVFSIGYMADEPPAAYGRYFCYHSLFIFSMVLLVIAPNLLQAFAGWELVGLTSYLLIGYYFRKPSAAKAAVKAFWVTKFADMGLLIGLILLFAQTGSFEWEVSAGALSAGWATTITLLLFLAVMGKSAQFPLHVWLPNAMEGPTPVSALLHAATMVAAGVFLIVRAYPLFEMAPDTQTVMIWIGGFTALFAAVLATIQTDIKRVLAFSTCSQLGYMVCALGAGSIMGGYFHLTTHACFKALLFLAAGSIIHGVHSNEMSDMGGLWKKMRLTSIVFIVGALALAGFPGFSGFFSKDLILEVVYEEQLWGPLAFLLVAAFLTAFYMGRVVFMVFFGKPSKAAEHAHESGFSMLLPLIVLALGAVGVGYFGKTFAAMYGVEYTMHIGTVGIIGTTLGLAGIVLSYLVYGRKSIPMSSFSFLAPIDRIARSGAIDKFYDRVFHEVMIAWANVIGWFDRYVIDGLINLIGYFALVLGKKARNMQTGNVRDYVFAVVAGLIVLCMWGLLG